MIRSLRRRHRAAMLALSLTLPVLFAAGLAVRRPMPQVALPAGLAGPVFDSRDVLATQLKNTGSGLALRITTLASVAGTADRRLVVELLSDPGRPELLVYWRAGRIDPGDGVGDAHLLGALSGGTPALLPLPGAAGTEEGSLIFYSLAQQEVVDSVELRRPPDEDTGGVDR